MSVVDPTKNGLGDPGKARVEVQRAMTEDAGVVRSAASLDRAEAALAPVELAGATPAAAEVANLVTVGRALVASARARAESRGCHWRSDHDRTDPALALRIVHAGG